MKKFKSQINIPGYRIIRKIGEGGMSVVYLAFQESLKREVALKVMRAIITDEESVVRRFEQEAEIIAKLYHPNIVNIYEVGHVDDEVLFYSMPYLQHGDLTSVAYQSDEALKKLIASICDGMAYAHTQGVVHRDIKPENILFDQFGNVQIADFGIALSTGRRRFTKDSKIVGSIYYMSPEQAQSKHVDKRSDVYGLGAILYELLTGNPVFDEDSDLSLMMAHLNNPIPRLPNELAHWQQVIDKCLAKSPSQRYQDMESLKQAVLSVDVQRPQKMRISPMVLSFSAACLVVLVWLFLWMRSDQATNPTETAELPEVSENQSTAQTSPTEQPPSQPNIDLNTELNSGLNSGLNRQSSSEQVVDESSNRPAVINQLSDAEVTALLQQAQKNIAEKQLTTPADDNALDQILKLLKNIPDHQTALNLLSDVMAGYYQLLYQALNNNNFKLAATFADSVSEVRHKTILVDEALLIQLEQNTDLDRSLLLGAVVEKVKAAKQSLNQQQAQQLISMLDQVIPGQELVDDLLNSISSMLKPGQILTDNQGIKTVVITPQYNNLKTSLKYGLAVTQSEITFTQYDRFVQATGYELQRCKSKLKTNLIFSQRNYSRPGFKVTKNMPVVCVTWHDANQFASWLSQKSGLSYRLPTAREWTQINKLSQHKSACGDANLAGQEFPDKSTDIKLYGCDDGSLHVASIDNKYPKNKLGLIGFAGNVSEWLAGCEKMGKFKAIFNPDDQCDNNPVAGRSWLSGRDDTGAVHKVDFDQAWTHIGFRLIRDLRKEQ